MTQYGLIGRSLVHSFSQKYFNDKFRRLGLDCTYSNFPIEDISMLPALLAAHPNLRGFNVTIPYKESIIPYLSDLTDIAKKVGAVNTVVITSKGLKGHNTDVEGLMNMPPVEKALILGTGGAAKAVKTALELQNIDCTFVSRSHSKASLTYQDLDKNTITSHLLIVNATPLGTFPNIDAKPDIPYQAITEHHYAFDLVYNPSETAFLKACRSYGATTTNGLNMLHKQAEAAWEWWNEANV